MTIKQEENWDGIKNIERQEGEIQKKEKVKKRLTNRLEGRRKGN